MSMGWRWCSRGGGCFGTEGGGGSWIRLAINLRGIGMVSGSKCNVYIPKWNLQFTFFRRADRRAITSTEREVMDDPP